jgi:alpha-aminoadipic semialdehyde synthase
VVDPSIFYENLKTQVAQCVGAGRVSAIESLGLLEEDLVLKLGTPLDSLSHFLSIKLSIGM